MNIYSNWQQEDKSSYLNHLVISTIAMILMYCITYAVNIIILTIFIEVKRYSNINSAF